MASQASVKVTTTSPKGGKGDAAPAAQSGSPKGQCLCSPTTHQGSFRCRFHRSTAPGSSAWIMKRSKSMPANNSAAVASFSPKSVEST